MTKARVRPKDPGKAATALEAWLIENERSSRWLAKVIGVNYFTALGWIAGRWVPSIASAARIERVTEGVIPIVSWLSSPPAKKAWDAMVARAEAVKKHPGYVMGMPGRKQGSRYD